jgi:hypothetical protein
MGKIADLIKSTLKENGIDEKDYAEEIKNIENTENEDDKNAVIKKVTTNKTMDFKYSKDINLDNKKGKNKKSQIPHSVTIKRTIKIVFGEENNKQE